MSYGDSTFADEYVDIMKKLVMVSRNRDRADEIVSRHNVVVPPTPGPMAHQFDLFAGNEPTPQIMLQLIGCRIEIQPQAGESKREAST